MEISQRLDVITDKAVQLRQALNRSVHARRADALMLSGGIDSSILCALEPDVPAFTVVLEGQGQDLHHAQQVTEYLGTPWYGIEVSQTEALSYLGELVKLTKSYDPGLLNDIPLYAAMKHAASLGARTIRTGDFSDSLFAGYRYLWEEKNLSGYLTDLLPHVKLASSILAEKMGLNTHYPYLHPEVTNIAIGFTPSDNLAEVETTIPGDFVETLTDGPETGTRTWSKITLRRAALGLLPTSIAFRTKADLEFGSGMHKLEEALQAELPPSKFEELKRDKKFWNQMHAAIYTIYKEQGLQPTPPQNENEYACTWCGGGVINGRHHCATCGAYPSNQ